MKCGWQLSWPTRWKLRSTLGHVESTYKQWTQCGKLLMFDEQLKDGRGHSMKVSVAVSLSKREKRFSLFRHKSGTPVCISLFRSEKKINPCLQSSKKKSQKITMTGREKNVFLPINKRQVIGLATLWTLVTAEVLVWLRGLLMIDVDMIGNKFRMEFATLTLVWISTLASFYSLYQFKRKKLFPPKK